jgi:hypothetical protein
MDEKLVPEKGPVACEVFPGVYLYTRASISALRNVGRD